MSSGVAAVESRRSSEPPLATMCDGIISASCVEEELYAEPYGVRHRSTEATVSTETGVSVSFQTRVESDKRAADIQYITVRPTY